MLTVRTSTAAEEEIREVFDQMGRIICQIMSHVMADFEINADREFKPKHEKV
jgi:thymidylate synthase ThyX